MHIVKTFVSSKYMGCTIKKDAIKFLQHCHIYISFSKALYLSKIRQKNHFSARHKYINYRSYQMYSPVK